MQKILVIEDEQNVRDSILDILNAEDFYAIGAENGQVGVQAADEFQPNLVICDVMMPELDGYAVLTQLRQNPKTETIPFVFLSAKSEKVDFRQGMDLGADDYLTKPFTRTELLQAISTRLEKQTTIEQQSQQKLDNLRQSISLALPHELNTALNVIHGTASMLMEECDSASREEIFEMADIISTNSMYLRRLIQNFLLIAKLELIATNPEQIRAMRNCHIDDSQTLITWVALQKAEQFQRESDLELDLREVPVQISEQKLKKIVEEVLDNALKFSPVGSPVQVFSSKAGDNFVLHIIDHGRGMTREQIADVGACMQFEREQQEQEGTGLGLAIAKRLTELHGGELGIESIPGQQTVIRVSIPCNLPA